MSASGYKVLPDSAPVEANCAERCGANDARTEEVRRLIQSSLSYGSEAWLSRESGVCLATTRKAIEGECRLPASLLRAALRMKSPDEQAALLSIWLGVPLGHRP